MNFKFGRHPREFLMRNYNNIREKFFKDTVDRIELMVNAGNKDTVIEVPVALITNHYKDMQKWCTWLQNELNREHNRISGDNVFPYKVLNKNSILCKSSFLTISW